MSFVEIHFHLLPGVDDGPSSLDESVALAAAAISDGTQVVVVTPHVHPEHVTEPSEIPDRTRELADHLRRQQLRLVVLPGGELDYRMVGRLSQPELEHIAQGPQNRRWLLLEAPFAGLDEHFEAAADELRERGFGIVLAHPERALQTPETRTSLERELSLGSVFQLTAGSLLDVSGVAVRNTALRLLRSVPRAAIASDAHGSHRPPALRPALEALLAARERNPDRLAAAVPRSLLERGLAPGRDALVA
jgi:protein-tyrosine phosphatase